MATLIELAPQIAVALAIVAAVLIMNRQVVKLAHTMTRPDTNGGRRNRLEAIEERLEVLPCETHSRLHDTNDRAHRKIFAAVHVLRRGQTEILEHLTGSPSTGEELPAELEDMDTGQFEIPELEAGAVVKVEAGGDG
jgi:hypothetical protein